MSDRELAGYVAPILRSTDERVLRRRVQTYDRETGEVTGEVTMREVVGGLAQATALGLEVVEGVRPKETACTLCGRPVPVPRAGFARSVCREEDGGCHRQKTCASKGCTAPPGRSAFKRQSVIRRNGRPWLCQLCASAMVPSEKRSEGARKANAARTPERRSEMARRLNAARTTEERSATSRKAAAARTPEERSQAAKQANAVRTPEERRTIAKKRQAAQTPEQRRETARKAHATRRGRLAK